MTEVGGVDALRDQIRTARAGLYPVLRINLAIALANRSNALADLGQREEALAQLARPSTYTGS